jgi:hypothetical protein
MPQKLSFRKTVAEAIGCDPRTLTKYKFVKPIGLIEVQGRKFDVYDQAGINALIQNQKESQNGNDEANI